MAWEASQPGVDARRALFSRMVLDHRLSAQDPLEPTSIAWEGEAAELVFADHKIATTEVAGLLV
jgi:acyl-CoA dehydrogenase